MYLVIKKEYQGKFFMENIPLRKFNQLNLKEPFYLLSNDYCECFKNKDTRLIAYSHFPMMSFAKEIKCNIYNLIQSNIIKHVYIDVDSIIDKMVLFNLIEEGYPIEVFYRD